MTIRIDYTDVLADVVGAEHGLRPEELQGLELASQAALAAVQGRRQDDLRWLDLPYQEETLDEILAYTSEVKGRFENVCVLGIGGSALGNRALHTALNSPYHELSPPSGTPRLFVLDNVDPDLIGEFLERVPPEKTLFNVISKSGGTAETMSQFLIFRQQLLDRVGADGLREGMVCTTAAESGVLREIVEREGYRSFVVPEGVGGRFSVLSPVGLLSSALVGIDVRGLLRGAADMDTRCRSSDLFENPALLFAALQFLLHTLRGKPIAVMFPYSHRLRDCADWYAQLLAESIGKRVSRSGEVVHAGPTPVRAVGVTDQHSQVQLYTEGPFDKWFTLLSVDTPDHRIEIPSAFPEIEGAAYLAGRTLGELFHAERDGTRIALTEAKRPNATISLEKVDERSLGGLLFMLELAIAVMGEHYDVNAFDQPGVEAGKVAAYALMGREGYEQRQSEILGAARGTRHVVS